MTDTKQKDILDTFTESFPLLEAMYDTYDLTPLVSTDQENTLRRSVEITTLEMLELVVVASRQSFQEKKVTLRQCANKVDTLKVFVDLGVQTGTIPEEAGKDLLKSINAVGEMVGVWMSKVTEATEAFNEDNE